MTTQRGKRRDNLGRAATDRSVRTARRRTDLDLEKRDLDMTDEADEVVRSARLRAAAVLRKARRRTDEARPRSTNEERERERRSRKKEDEKLQREYADADTQLVGDRVARKRALAILLLAER